MDITIKLNPQTAQKIKRINELSSTFDNKGLSQREIVDLAVSEYLSSVTSKLHGKLRMVSSEVAIAPESDTSPIKPEKVTYTDWSFLNWDKLMDGQEHIVALKAGLYIKFRSRMSNKAHTKGMFVSIIPQNNAKTSILVKFSKTPFNKLAGAK